MSVDGMLLRRVLSATERNALVTQMRNGNGPTARSAGAKALDLTLDEYDDLLARAKEKVEKAAARERADDAAAQFGRPPVRPIEEVAMEAAGVEDPSEVQGNLDRDGDGARELGPRLSRYRWPNSNRALEAVPIAIELLRERGTMTNGELTDELEVTAATFNEWIRPGLIDEGVHAAKQGRKTIFSVAAEAESEEPEPVRPEPDTPPMPTRASWTPTPGTNAARILWVLQRQGEPIRQSDLAVAAGVRPGSIVDAAMQLEREGYAVCVRRDGRGVFWQVTQLGSDFGVEQPSGTETTAAPDDDGGRGGVPHDATAAASSAPDQPEGVEESERSAAGTAAGLPSAGEPTADDEAAIQEDAPVADEDRKWAAERMAEADTGQGDPREMAGRATRPDPADFRHPPSMLPAVAEAVNGQPSPIGVEVELQGPSYRDLYVYTLLRKIEEDDGTLAVHIYDRIERQIEAADGAAR